MRCDVCIVGGGFTGLWTALAIRQLEPSADVVVLEADVCGGGASGRNGGFAMTMWSKFSSLKKLGATADAVWLAQQAAESVSAIGAFCTEHGIDAAYRRNGWVWAATSEAQLGAWDATMEALAAAGIGEALEPLQPDEVARRTGSDAHLAGVFDPDVAHLQPAALARGMARVARGAGHPHPRGHPDDGARANVAALRHDVAGRGARRHGGAGRERVGGPAARGAPVARRHLVRRDRHAARPGTARADRLDVGARPVRVRLAPARELLPPDT